MTSRRDTRQTKINVMKIYVPGDIIMFVNVNYYLRPDQVFEWFRNKSKYRVQMYGVKVILKITGPFVGKTKNNKVYIKNFIF